MQFHYSELVMDKNSTKSKIFLNPKFLTMLLIGAQETKWANNLRSSLSIKTHRTLGRPPNGL